MRYLRTSPPCVSFSRSLHAADCGFGFFAASCPMRCTTAPKHSTYASSSCSSPVPGTSSSCCSSAASLSLSDASGSGCLSASLSSLELLLPWKRGLRQYLCFCASSCARICTFVLADLVLLGLQQHVEVRHEAADQHVQLHQYSYFCTSKASKLST
jgi:hypothetical protein